MCSSVRWKTQKRFCRYRLTNWSWIGGEFVFSDLLVSLVAGQFLTIGRDFGDCEKWENLFFQNLKAAKVWIGSKQIWNFPDSQRLGGKGKCWTSKWPSLAVRWTWFYLARTSVTQKRAFFIWPGGDRGHIKVSQDSAQCFCLHKQFWTLVSIVISWTKKFWKKKTSLDGSKIHLNQSKGMICVCVYL